MGESCGLAWVVAGPGPLPEDCDVGVRCLPEHISCVMPAGLPVMPALASLSFPPGPSVIHALTPSVMPPAPLCPSRRLLAGIQCFSLLSFYLCGSAWEKHGFPINNVGNDSEGIGMDGGRFPCGRGPG